jgi:hypothetical protein
MKMTTRMKTGLMAKAAQLKDTIESEGRISVSIRNNEFYPTIVEGDRVRVIREHPQNLMRGDVVLLMSKADIVVRRIQKIKRLRETIEFHVASNKPHDEMNITGDHIFGRIVAVTRGSQKITFDVDITMKNFLFMDVRLIWAKILRGNSTHSRNAMNKSAFSVLCEDSGVYVA